MTAKKSLLKPNLTIKKEEAISIRILSVKDIEFSFLPLEKFEPKGVIDEKKLSFRLDYKFEFDSTSQILEVHLRIIFSYNKKLPEIIRYHACFNFSVENYSSFIVMHKNKATTVDKRLTLQLIGPSLSTMRGMMLMKLANTDLNSIIIPLMDRESLEEMVGSSVQE